jgi:hypothetical protein
MPLDAFFGAGVLTPPAIAPIQLEGDSIRGRHRHCKVGNLAQARKERMHTTESQQRGEPPCLARMAIHIWRARRVSQGTNGNFPEAMN